jgi:hypothetical protein
MGNVAGTRTAAYGDARVGERRVRVRRSERIVLECDCGERLVVIGPMAFRRSGCVLECVCGGRFTLAGRVAVRDHDHHDVIGHRKVRNPEEERRYSWLEDCLERLRGKEARQEYYARLEQAASW